MGSYPKYGIILLLILFLPWKILFMFIIITGSIFAISASSWFIAWIGLEINIVSLLALFLRKKSPRNSEATLKYFLVQALASAILIFAALLRIYESLFFSSVKEINSLITLRLLIKLGASPFHVWIPQVVEGLRWIFSFIVLSWQKLVPFFLLSLTLFNSYKIFFFASVIISSLIGAVNGLSQSSIRKLLAFSSVNHLGWIISRLVFKISSWLCYFSTYCAILAILIYHVKANNIRSISNFWSSARKKSFVIRSSLIISFGGLPPFIGFLPKWLVLSDLLSQKFNFISLILVMSSLITLFFYLRIIFPGLLMATKRSLFFRTPQKMLNLFFVFNLSGLALTPIMFSFV